MADEEPVDDVLDPVRVDLLDVERGGQGRPRRTGRADHDGVRQRRHQTGQHQRRLAAAGRAGDHQDTVAVQLFGQLTGAVLAAEEVLGVLGLERLQAAERARLVGGRGQLRPRVVQDRAGQRVPDAVLATGLHVHDHADHGGQVVVHDRAAAEPAQHRQAVRPVVLDVDPAARDRAAHHALRPHAVRPAVGHAERPHPVVAQIALGDHAHRPCAGRGAVEAEAHHVDALRAVDHLGPRGHAEHGEVDLGRRGVTDDVRRRQDQVRGDEETDTHRLAVAQHPDQCPFDHPVLP
ncbi:hypothetical protein A6A25_00130 [Saccharothrix sp. CB00851]|nr:hypothetical protein [Saccharothrix sp. CB00851]OKI38672.1 hypothetical protein A6A25_00130 [Saccharothrix sp. CB00851]